MKKNVSVEKRRLEKIRKMLLQGKSIERIQEEMDVEVFTYMSRRADKFGDIVFKEVE